MRIALTGGIACGKSLFAKFLRALGVQTLDADDIVHELIPECQRCQKAQPDFATMGIVLGFAVMMLLDVMLG